MKRFALLLALLAALLTGCYEDGPSIPPTNSSAPTTAGTIPTEDPGLYDPDHRLESQTGGAVKVYPLEEDYYTCLLPFGEDLLLVQNLDSLEVVRLTGENLQLQEAAHLSDASVSCMQTSEKGLAYYDETARCVVFLDMELQEFSRIPLPEDASGVPMLSGDWETIYYCTDSQIRCLDLQTGISRLLREQACQWMMLEGIYFEGQVLECRIYEGDGSYLAYISTETGETLATDRDYYGMVTHQDLYFVYGEICSITEYLWGTTQGPVQSLEPKNPGFSIQPALPLEGILAYGTQETALQLEFYDLSTGCLAGETTLNGVSDIHTIATFPEDPYVWFLAYDTQSEQNLLCRWDPSLSATGDETIYTGPRYTADTPDEAGLAQCEQRAAALEARYGVDIMLWQDAMTEPHNCSFEAEYQVRAIDQALTGLEKALSQYPEGFLDTASGVSDSGKLHIGIVRSIEGAITMDGVQYWLDGDACITLRADAILEQTLYHEMSHIIDTLVFSYSRHYDDWDSLNPEGFQYDNDYVINQNRDNSQWLEGDSRAFIDTYSMSFASEDRARILEYACLPCNDDLFQSEILQAKLLRICKAIREAFALDGSQTLLWEQYLAEPLT